MTYTQATRHSIFTSRGDLPAFAESIVTRWLLPASTGSSGTFLKFSDLKNSLFSATTAYHTLLLITASYIARVVAYVHIVGAA